MFQTLQLALLNSNLKDYEKTYLFAQISSEISQTNKKDLINLGIGDIAFSLSPAIQKALISAADEMGSTPIGYGPGTGYRFLKEAIHKKYYSHLSISPDEIFIADGICSDLSNFSELFDQNNLVAIQSPTYPLYLDLNIMAGRKVVFLPLTEENHFKALPPEEHVDIIFLCSPNNPTGTAYAYHELKAWVDYAIEHDAIIFYDGAYEPFISGDEIPHSIYEIEGASKVAVEFRSFSKGSGFTGLRCSWSIVPKTLQGSDMIHKLWVTRQEIKTNGVSYPIQKAALAALTEDGWEQTQGQITAYKKTTKQLFDVLNAHGHPVYGGEHSPYIWWKIPSNFTSWEFFHFLLHEYDLVCIPGEGFGSFGQGFVRLSGFTTEEKAHKATLIFQQLAITYAH